MTTDCNVLSALDSEDWGSELWLTPEGPVLLPVVPLGPALDRWLIKQAEKKSLETGLVDIRSEGGMSG